MPTRSIPRARNAVPAIVPDLHLAIAYRSPSSLTAHPRNARTHTKRQIKLIAESLKTFGFVSPVVVDDRGEIIAGHGRVQAARQLGLDQVPVVQLNHLGEAERAALRLADNRLAELAGWDREILALEIGSLKEFGLNLELSFDLGITGFSQAAIERLEDAKSRETPRRARVPGKGTETIPISVDGDEWILGDHRVFCAAGASEGELSRFLSAQSAALAIVRTPAPAFPAILQQGGDGARLDRPHLIFTRAPELPELMRQAEYLGLSLRDVCAWDTGRTARGSLYRAQHELVCVFSGAGAGGALIDRRGRHRSNLWSYPAGSEGGMDELPARLLADAICDFARRGEAVLFLGRDIGAALEAGRQTERRIVAVADDPTIIDAAVRRWDGTSHNPARLASTGLALQEVALRRGERTSRPSESPRVRVRTRPLAA